jgi:mono/diheme cytochrome c family protein
MKWTIAFSSVLLIAGLSLLTACRQGELAKDGHALYVRYCASCHGMSGKGDGPIAASLRQRPADLTQLAKRAGGRFDEPKVLSIIDGRRSVAEHGPREMPVWGAVFDEELKEQLYKQYTGLLQSRVLVDYLRSLQEE